MYIYIYIADDGGESKQFQTKFEHPQVRPNVCPTKTKKNKNTMRTIDDLSDVGFPNSSMYLHPTQPGVRVLMAPFGDLRQGSVLGSRLKWVMPPHHRPPEQPPKDCGSTAVRAVVSGVFWTRTGYCLHPGTTKSGW